MKLPEYVAEVQHGAFGIFDCVGGNEEDSRGGKEAGRPLPSIECNVGTPATAELSIPCTLPCCTLTDTCPPLSTDASQTQRHERLRRRLHRSHVTYPYDRNCRRRYGCGAACVYKRPPTLLVRVTLCRTDILYMMYITANA